MLQSSNKCTITDDGTVIWPKGANSFFVDTRMIGALSNNGHPPKEVPTHKAIIRKHPDKPNDIAVLGVVGDRYTVQPNHSIYEAVERGLSINIDPQYLAGAYFKDEQVAYGAKCFREYIIPNMPRNSDEKLGFRVVVVNAFDYSHPVRVYSGAIDFFCTNGMIVGDYAAAQRKHTGAIDLRSFTNIIAKSVEDYASLGLKIETWKQKEVPYKFDAKEWFESLGFASRLADNLHEQFAIETVERGHTTWALASALTYYASHDSDRFSVRSDAKASTPNILHRRAEEVRRILNNNEMFVAA